ncbi:hypothetical protein PISMIDRAFT_647200, partial [Pisolithus microcarpus 441]
SASATPSKIHHGTHFRLVFKEVYQPIFDRQRLDTVLQTLMGVHAALQFLHSVDWVHRVISSGNVLHSSEMSKLVDPEYAKHMDSNTTHEVRTGTLEFMANEVEAQKYLFGPYRLKAHSEDHNWCRLSSIPYTTWSLSGGSQRGHSITMLIRRAANHRQSKLRNFTNSSPDDLTAHHISMRFILLSTTKCFRPL